MEKNGLVIKTKEGDAVVRVSPGHCGDCKACPMGRLFSAGPEEYVDVTASNEMGANAGDAVRVELSAGRSLLAYLIAYGLPLLGLIAGVIGGSLAAPGLGVSESLSAALFSMVGLAAGFGLTILAGKGFKGKPRIAEILKRRGRLPENCYQKAVDKHSS